MHVANRIAHLLVAGRMLSLRGSAIARIVGSNTKNYPDDFHPTVRMWVFEEVVHGEKLSDIINTRHENVKYLPGKKIPDNVVAVPDLIESCEDSNILIFVVPHQFVRKICHQLEGKIAADAQAISLIKGIAAKPDPREKVKPSGFPHKFCERSQIIDASTASPSDVYHSIYVTLQ
ncbi:hypothetical protein GCK32_015694 [Trichostrongylus colubriformis]|uniref:Glycerol-3-phosphate dehydrogenase NAD-dependent N-terminal domain-containing protein n=1 Tax=Trichostrongylus colubriformis TaxID=6319 RepID=A0AAN8FMF2_TRICO